MGVKLLSKLSNKRVIVPLVLVGFLLLIILPPILYGYIYPNNGDDSAHHLQYFDAIGSGVPASAMYLGRLVVGYPLVWLSNVSNLSVDVLYLWFNFGTLLLIGIVVYKTVSLVFNWQAGLLTVPLVLFVTPSTLNLFDNGAVYDLITVGALLPLFLLCSVYAVKTRIPWLWYAVALFPFLVCFHSISLVSSLSIDPSISKLVIVPEGKVVTAPQAIESGLGVIFEMSLFVAAVGCMSLLLLFRRYKDIKIDRSQKMLILLLLLTIVGLFIGMVSGIGGIAMRFAVDLCIVLAMFVGCLVGVVWQTIRSKAVLCGMVVLVVLCSVPVVKTYLEYNSALAPVDLEAIEYVNNLEGEYYSCSSEIAPWIYGRVLDKTYKEDSSLYIYRNKAMSYATSRDTPYFWGDKDGDILNMRILASFSDEKERGIQIVIWCDKD